jgi:hypothetical protein
MIPKNKTKQNKSAYLQQQWDDKEVGVLYNIVWQQKGIDASIKGLLTYMCNDVGMNGAVTWKQMTYADKLGMSRQHIMSLFAKFEDLRILIPDKSNKPGAKHNTYRLVLNFDALRKTNNGFKKNMTTPVDITCKPQLTLHDNPSLPTCQPEFTYKTTKTCIKHVLKEEKDSLTESPLQEPKGPVFTEEAFNEFLNDTNL